MRVAGLAGRFRRAEPHRDRVHTVSHIAGREALALEDVTEVPSTTGALDLDSHAIRVR